MIQRKHRFFCASATFLTFFSLSAAAIAAPFEIKGRDCSLLVNPQTPEEIAARHAFHPAVKADLSKSILLDDFPVHNQGQYGCCWSSSASAEFERKLFQHFGKQVPLSDEYQILITLFYRIEEALFYGDAISQGGWQETANWMFTHIGIYPVAGGWKPKKDLMAPGAAKEFLGFLNYEIANFQAQLKQMKVRGASNEEAWTYALKKRTELDQHLRRYLGNPPGSFVFDGKKYTPNSFMRTIVPKEEMIQVVSYAPSEPRAALRKASDEADVILEENSLFDLFPETKKFLVREPKAPGAPVQAAESMRLYNRSHMKTPYERNTAPLKEIHAKLAEALKAGESVFISTPMVRQFINNPSGVISIRATGATIEDAKKAVFSGGHAMLITGAYFDQNNVLLGYRIQNSWGEKHGKLGYFYMDVDYFDAFVDSVKFSKRKPAPAKPAPVIVDQKTSTQFVPKMKPKVKPTVIKSS